MMTMEIGLQAPLEQAPLEIEVEVRSRSIVVVRLSGTADAEQVDELMQHLMSAVRRGPCFIILDLERLNLLSPVALGCLEAFRREQCRQGGEVWLAGLQPAVWLALQAAGLDRRFTVRASLAQVFAA
jgi:anti-anti-sigma factor